MAHGILKLLRDRDLAARLAAAGRSHVYPRYDSSRLVGDVVVGVREAEREEHRCGVVGVQRGAEGAVAGRTLSRAEWADALPGRPYAPACR